MIDRDTAQVTRVHHASAWIEPTRRQRCQTFACDVLGALMIVALVTAAIVSAGAWLLPSGHAQPGTLRRWLALITFFPRVFQFQMGLGVAVVAVVAWLVRHRRTGVAGVVLAFALLMPFIREYAPKRPPPAGGKTLRVMSVNLWSANRHAQDIIAAIEREDPDVIVAIEVTAWSWNEIFGKRFVPRYPFVHEARYHGGGMVISRVPFTEDRGWLSAADSRPPTLRVPLVFQIDGRPFALYPLHLVSPGTVQNLTINQRQVDELLAIARWERRPMMFAGDFNFTQLTPQYGRMNEAGFRSTHDLAGVGVGTTWGPRWSWLNALPGVRIDHMLLRPPLTAVTHRVGRDTGSDHRPIVAEIGFAANGQAGARP